MQLKAFINNRAKKEKLRPQHVMQIYMLERFLERVSLSKYKSNFIFKGGVLISSILGLNARTTMDMDTTMKGFPLTHDAIRNIFNEICTIAVDDEIEFELVAVSDIRKGGHDPGIRITLNANYPPIKAPFTIDVTSGDVITPKEIEYDFPFFFENRKVTIFAYTPETVLAEKIEAVLSRGIESTRPRDYYDIYMIYTFHRDIFDVRTLRLALERTADKRGSGNLLNRYHELIEEIRSSRNIHRHWKKYQQDFSYAAGISFGQICDAIEELMQSVMTRQPPK